MPSGTIHNYTSPPSCNGEQKGKISINASASKFCEMNVTARTTSTTGVRIVCARIRIPNFLKQLCHNIRCTACPPFLRISTSRSMQSVLPLYHRATTVRPLAHRTRSQTRSPAITSSLGRESNFTLMIIKCLPFAASYAMSKTSSAALVLLLF